MTDLPKSVVFIAGAVIGLVASVMFSGGMNLSGVYSQVENTFRDGLKVGTSDQLTVSSAGGVVSSANVMTSASVSVATTSTTRMVNAGAGASATTTIDIGKACFLITTDNGTPMYAWFRSGGGAIGALATSSSSCF